MEDVYIYLEKCIKKVEFMKRLLFLLLIVLLFYPVKIVSAVPILDQSQEFECGGSYILEGKHLAQTFTTSNNGFFDSIDLLVDTWSDSPDYPVSISIMEGDPLTGVVLGSSVFTTSLLGWNSFNFRSKNIFFDSGTIYSVVLSNDDPGCEDGGSTFGVGICWFADRYADGALWNWTSSIDWHVFTDDDVLLLPGMHAYPDLSFRLYVDPAPVPEPSTILLLGVGLLGLVGIKSRKQKS